MPLRSEGLTELEAEDVMISNKQTPAWSLQLVRKTENVPENYNTG